jgi:hypothetical protein
MWRMSAPGKWRKTMKATLQRFTEEAGAIGYIILWALGVPASLLFVIFLMRGCT